MAEYYIRREGDDDASGPFDLDQLASLAELGKVDDTAFYYDMDAETWRPITDSEEAMSVLHPKKEKLALKSEDDGDAAVEDASSDEPASEPKGDDPEDEGGAKLATEESEKETSKKPKLKPKKEEAKPKPIVVEEMLAQAEGREGVDPNSRSPMEKRATAAFLGMRGAMALLLFSMIAMFVVEFDLVKTANAPSMLRSPYVIVGLIDFILAVFLILQVTEIYPLIRFKAALGFGFISLLFIASGDPMLALGNALICAAVYFAVSSTKLAIVLATLVVGLGGLALYALQLLPVLTG